MLREVISFFATERKRLRMPILPAASILPSHHSNRENQLTLHRDLQKLAIEPLCRFGTVSIFYTAALPGNTATSALKVVSHQDYYIFSQYFVRHLTCYSL
jgi:hypothetical protein